MENKRRDDGQERQTGKDLTCLKEVNEGEENVKSEERKRRKEKGEGWKEKTCSSSTSPLVFNHTHSFYTLLSSFSLLFFHPLSACLPPYTFPPLYPLSAPNPITSPYTPAPSPTPPLHSLFSPRPPTLHSPPIHWPPRAPSLSTEPSHSCHRPTPHIPTTATAYRPTLSLPEPPITCPTLLCSALLCLALNYFT